MAAARPPLSLKARALQWLAQREHSRLELRRKLMQAARRLRPAGDAGDGPDAVAEIEALLDWLTAHHHLSEARFVESRVHARAPRFGQRRIEQELRQHGAVLDDDTAAHLRETELERALAAYRRKFGHAPAADRAEHARRARFLAGRGFAADVIRRVVEERHDD